SLGWVCSHSLLLTGSAERSGSIFWWGLATAQFGVGGDGQAAGTGRGLLPFLPVGHYQGECLCLLPVMITHGAIAGGQVLVAYGAAVVAGLAGGVDFGVGAD